MALNRGVAIAVMFSIVGTAFPVSAGTSARPVSLRALLETKRRANTEVIVELGTGWHLLGSIGRTHKATFYVLDGTSPGGRAVRFLDVRALIDPVTGQRFEFLQASAPTGPVVGPRPPLKFWIILGAAVVVALIWARAATSGNF